MSLPVLLLGMSAALPQIPGLPSQAETSETRAVQARTIPVADIPQRVDEDESLIQGVIDFRVRCWKLRGKS